jgi:hypothetical protein
MRRVIIGITAAMALALVGVARADDTKSSESKSTEKKSDTATKTEKKAVTEEKGTGGSSLDTSSEKKAPPESPGMKETKPDEKAAPAK